MDAPGLRYWNQCCGTGRNSPPPQGERRVFGMQDLTIAPGQGIPDGLVVAAADLSERFAKASGPGG